MQLNSYVLHTPEPLIGSALDMVHDIRQSLSSIEAIAYYLEKRLGAEHAELMEYALKLQDLVGQADSRLTDLLRS